MRSISIGAIEHVHLSPEGRGWLRQILNVNNMRAKEKQLAAALEQPISHYWMMTNARTWPGEVKQSDRRRISRRFDALINDMELFGSAGATGLLRQLKQQAMLGITRKPNRPYDTPVHVLAMDVVNVLRMAGVEPSASKEAITREVFELALFEVKAETDTDLAMFLKPAIAGDFIRLHLTD